MPVFTKEDIKQIEVANQIRSILSSVHYQLGDPEPVSITATYNFETGELSYEIKEKKATK